ncbi:hypothetical protein ACIP98_24690 [Streptomyces sp. NPDC088354]|uniref:hypothetical protein n=1 Tax=unclassified Streptomyces TaxID=2593676 RepID=UPI0029B2B782|nr:hypothetical protein [Streptomyces sp. MI02-7b]MDX3074848.1 hypothetical protein [Streptomyces sp. MI02-7b]
MNGPGPVPPPPSAQSGGSAVALRAIFLVLTALSCGFLSCLPLLHLAVQRRRTLDWVLFWVGTAVTIAAFATIGVLPESSGWTDVALITVISMVPLVGVHYLVADMALHRKQALTGYPPYATTVPYPPQQPQPAYNPYNSVPAPPPARPASPSQPPAAPPHPPRLNQVRAELDELSDLLRKQEDQ